MRRFAATLAFASSCLMLGLMVNGRQTAQDPLYYFPDLSSIASRFWALYVLGFLFGLTAAWFLKELYSRFLKCRTPESGKVGESVGSG